MKNIIKKIPFIMNIINRVRFKREFINDYNFFKKYYIGSKKNKVKIEYDILLIVHSLEKGMSNKNPRPFGKSKIDTLIYLLDEYCNITSDKSYAYNMGISALVSYIDFYKEHNFINEGEYLKVSNYLKNVKDYKKLLVGSFELKRSDFISIISNIDYGSFLESRHAVRNYSNVKLKDEDIKRAIEMSIKSPSACNRQMVKVYYINSTDKKDYIIKHAQGLTNFDLDNVNFFVITFDVSANYFVGERNQGWFNAGLFSMNFVNSLHSLSIGSCFLQFGSKFKEELKFKKVLNIPNSERIAVIIACGYYSLVSKIPYSTRKDINDIYNIR